MAVREGSLEAPTRHALDWRSPDFYDEKKVFAELERVPGRGFEISFANGHWFSEEWGGRRETETARK